MKEAIDRTEEELTRRVQELTRRVQELTRLVQQVDYYMGQHEAKIIADFTRGMGQQNRTGQNITPVGGF